MRIGDQVRHLDWVRRLPALVVDAAIAAVFVALVAADRLREPLNGVPETLGGVAFTLTVAVSLFVRRRFPMTALVAGTAAVAAESVFGITSVVSPYGGQILVYGAGLYATRSRSLWTPPLILAGVVVYFSGTADALSPEPVGVLFVWLVTWALGYSSARRREEQERARVAIRRQVVAEEQTRMARELHDLVGHTVNLLVVQAGAARVMLDTDPTTTRNLLTGMEATGREALADLDQVLGTLRAHSTPDGSATGPASIEMGPSPGLAQLPDLVGRLNDAQVHVTLTVDPGTRLSRNLDFSAYRIVQEALTNVLKHAAPCSATVAVHCNNGSVVVEVADDGPVRAHSHVAGRGLMGIGERVSASGGTLEHGPGTAGGFTVRAVLPLP